MVTKSERAESNRFKEMIDQTNALRATGGLPPKNSMFAHMVIPDDAKPSTKPANETAVASPIAAMVTAGGSTSAMPDPAIQSLRSQLPKKNAELATLLNARVSEKDRPFVAGWIENRANCQAEFPSIELYAAFERHRVG